ncbi:hypothetical protein EIP91_010897 [Steccherinum ochraceum]|uniref:N-acetyltransferase domain-containing protein n=1 Tax=Steccherinum ochraceum TaxID=92696 RepID=A0A4R0RWL3_9APHY|nr:hypothetical protein EIP91_010897 [Steccherinum ochraceum]
MVFDFEIRHWHLTHPTDDELNAIASILTAGFSTSPITILGSGGRKENEHTFHKVCAAGAAAGAYLFVAVLHGTNDIIGCVFFYPPGKAIMGDELQRAQGFDQYLAESLTEEQRDAFIQFEVKYGSLGDAVLPPGEKDRVWSVNSLAVAELYRKNGVARALLEAGEALAKADRSKVVFEAETDDTLKMYVHLGYTFVKTVLLDDVICHVIVKDFTV